MIVYRNWQKKTGGAVGNLCEGWFLFGILPLYIRSLNVKVPLPKR
ncbi:hypothetical protein [Geothrix campi]|nr:hypothetical protein [Geothrix sp. SG10]